MLKTGNESNANHSSKLVIKTNMRFRDQIALLSFRHIVHIAFSAQDPYLLLIECSCNIPGRMGIVSLFSPNTSRPSHDLSINI